MVLQRGDGNGKDNEKQIVTIMRNMPVAGILLVLSDIQFRLYEIGGSGRICQLYESISGMRFSMRVSHYHRDNSEEIIRYGRCFQRLLLGVVGLALLLDCGCAIPRNQFGRSRVSGELARRTDQVLLSRHSMAPMIPESIESGGGLTERDAVTLALWNNPAYEELLCDLGLSHADVLDANQLQNPDVSILFPLGPKQLEFAINVPLDSILLRPARLELAILRSQQVGNRVVQDSLNFVRDVRIAHSDLLLAQDQLKNAQAQYHLLERITSISESRLAAGTTGELDVMTTRIELQTTKERLERASHDVENAKNRLKTLMGLTFSDMPIVAIGQPQQVFVATHCEDLVATALHSRPDIWAARYAYKAACRQAGLVQWDFISTTGIVSGKQNGKQIGPGLAMSVPIFHMNGASKYRAAEEVRKTCFHLEGLQQGVASEVRAACIIMEQAKNSWNHWNNDLIPAATEAVTTSEKAYRAGGDYLLLTLHNSQRLLDAELKKAEAAAELRKSIAELERSIGTVAVDKMEIVPIQPVIETAGPVRSDPQRYIRPMLTRVSDFDGMSKLLEVEE